MTTDTEQLPTDAATGAAPLVARLVQQHGAQWLRLSGLDAWLRQPGDQVLFFHGDPVRFPEVLDVAVVLPELQKAFPGRFGVAVSTRADEDALAAHFGVQRWPSLVFVRDGGYVAQIAGMLDWTDYLQRVGEALAAPTRRLPGVGIPVVDARAAAPGCH